MQHIDLLVKVTQLRARSKVYCPDDNGFFVIKFQRKVILTVLQRASFTLIARHRILVLLSNYISFGGLCKEVVARSVRCAILIFICFKQYRLKSAKFRSHAESCRIWNASLMM